MSDFNGSSFIVVGVDGSPAGRDALRWAARQARLTGAELHAVSAWHVPGGYGWAPDYSDADFAAEARKGLEETVADTLGADPGIHVITDVRQGHPAGALIDASAGAALLVVGSHGHGAFAGMLLGSVSQHCAQHAHCPVVVIRRPADGARPGR